MKILITGSNGMLGYALMKCLSRDHCLSGLGRHTNQNPDIKYFQVDITNQDKLRSVVESVKPELIIHAAAYTDVDGCETNPKEATDINFGGTKNIVDAVQKTNTQLIFISTDYVFSGKKGAPYCEDDLTDPVSVYGRSKLEAERYIQKNFNSGRYLIIRTSWLYGPKGKNFVESILKACESRSSLEVVSDHRGRPTLTLDLAKAIKQVVPLIAKVNGGILNISNAGETSWYEYAKEIISFENLKVDVKAITAIEFGRPARRPTYSVLNLNLFENLTHTKLRNWKEALHEYLSWRKNNV